MTPEARLFSLIAWVCVRTAFGTVLAVPFAVWGIWNHSVAIMAAFAPLSTFVFALALELYRRRA